MQEKMHSQELEFKHQRLAFDNKKLVFMEQIKSQLTNVKVPISSAHI